MIDQYIMRISERWIIDDDMFGDDLLGTQPCTGTQKYLLSWRVLLFSLTWSRHQHVRALGTAGGGLTTAITEILG